MLYLTTIPEEILILNDEAVLPDYYFETLLHVWVYPRRIRFKLASQTYSIPDVIQKSIQVLNSIKVEV